MADHLLLAAIILAAVFLQYPSGLGLLWGADETLAANIIVASTLLTFPALSLALLAI